MIIKTHDTAALRIVFVLLATLVATTGQAQPSFSGTAGTPGTAGELGDTDFLSRLQMMQQLIVKKGIRTTWLGGGDDSDGLSVLEMGASSTIVVPLPLVGAPLMVSPSASMTLLNGPDHFELPSKLYNFSASMMFRGQYSDRLSWMAGVTPSLSSDLEADENAFRTIGMAMGTFQQTEAFQWLFGVVYLNRNDIPILPVAGFIWIPNPDTRIELTAPRPRFAKRLPTSLSLLGLPDLDEWIYVAAELGGGSWAVQRDDGSDDELTLRDFRILAGYELKSQRKFSANFETGFVFGRDAEYENDGLSFQPGETFLMRLGVSF